MNDTLPFYHRRSSGKKATPPQSKSSAAAGNKVPTRPGNRSSARLSQEVLAPSVSKKNSPTVSGSRKRPAAGDNFKISKTLSKLLLSDTENELMWFKST